MTGPRETAAQLDRAIDDLLLGQGPRRLVVEGELTATARLLREALPRFHPRFGFEELLAARLATMRRSQDGITGARPTPIRPDLVVADDQEAGSEGAAEEAADRRRRGLVAGGAIASGVSLALPLAGAAFVVWRRSRSSGGIL